MDSARWARVEAIVAEALERDRAVREAYFAQACGTDAELRAEVESLVAAADDPGGFLERPIVQRDHGDTRDALSPVDEEIGPWVVQRVLGRGGMGDVYLATRTMDGVSQQAALKVIRRGLDTDEVVRRFRLERRILAQLSHSNVAQLMDVGVTREGRPYFAMEYIDGVPLTQFADERRLTVRARLELFQRVLDAVEHAHQRLVVHRDIKPRNILVSAAGMPKLLDFGIGKVLDESGEFGTAIETRTEARLLTPEYAAPEQVTGAYISTATDVYSLGVVLYELLAGVHPYVAVGMARAQVERAIVDVVPTRPSERIRSAPSDAAGASAGARSTDSSGLARQLAGDLDTIVLMALRKEPERRYASAAALALDIQRYLDGHPVSARPDTLGYRARKFVGRNRGVVVAAVAITLALVGVTAMSVLQARRVAAEAARTRAERDKAVEVRGHLMEMFGATGADRSVGDTLSVRGLLERQRAQVATSFAGREAVKADMLEVLADGYDRLGFYADAEPLAREALELRRRLLPADHPDVSASLNLLGWVTYQRGRYAEAESLFLGALRIRRADSLRSPDALSRTLNDLGVLYNAQRRLAEARRVLVEALVIRRAVLGDSHRAVGITANNVAAAFFFDRQVDSAVAYQSLALRSLRAAVGEDHQRTLLALNNLASMNAARGAWRDAESVYDDLIARSTRLQGRDHPTTVTMLGALANVLANRGQEERSDSILGVAEALRREVHVALERRLGSAHPEVAIALSRLGTARMLRGEPREAIEMQSRALAALRATLPDSNRNVQVVATALAQSWRRAGDSAAALRVLRQVGAPPPP